jgi:hypothetical protein
VSISLLVEADGVGHRHQDDLAAQPALGLQRAQALFEVPGHQHAGQFVGVQRGLDVDLAPAVGRAEVEAGSARGARQRCDQGWLC